jgi:AcrR family transcriptional regulator
MPKANAQVLADGSGTRERLLEAAVRGIAEHGWDRLTTRRVGEIAGLNPALVHYHFGSMAALRRAAALAVMADEIDAPTAALLTDLPVARAIEECLRAVAATDPRAPHALVLSEAMLASARDEELRDSLRRALESFRALLVDRIRAAGGVAPEAAAVLATAALDGLFLHRIVDPELDIRTATAALTAALMLPEAA